MASTDSEISLIYGTVQAMVQTAQNAYAQARSDLTRLAGMVTQLPLTKVNTKIATDTTLTWLSNPLSLDRGLPTEPQLYTAVSPTMSIPEVTVPPAIRVEDLPAWDVSLAGRPTDENSHTLASLPELGLVPEITAVAPVIDVGILETEFDFNEPEYLERLTPQVRTELTRVLGGGLGLPQTYWDSLWAKTAGDLAAQVIAQSRTMRNRGAASYWALPGETVLAAARVSHDAALQVVQEARLKQAHEQAVMAREDFWQAIQRAIGYEELFINAHQQVVARALSACEQLHSLRVQVHNANIARFNAELEEAKLSGSLDDLRVQRVLKAYAEQLDFVRADIEQDKERIALFQAQWAGYQTDKTVAITAAGEQIKRFSAEVDAHARYEMLKQQRSSIDVQRYSALVGRVANIGNATASLLAARTGVSDLQLKWASLGVEFDKAHNASTLDVSRITQEANKAEAQLDVTQAEWITGQAVALSQRIAELSWSYAQACMQVADVSYGRNINYGVSANQNEDLKW
jgi:hypothetical protein